MSEDQDAQLEVLLHKKKLLERRIELQEGLPFLYGWKWYKWARKFYESRNKMNLLVAGNQISKSSTQIRKCIDWATDMTKWKELWDRRPLQFWYLYPTKEIATIEFEKKWVPEFLPRGEFKSHPLYGWREEYRSKSIFAIHFNTGVSVYFKTYAQEAQNLQTGTCYAVFCFVAGTKISTPTGAKNIETLRVGDWVHTHKGPRRVVKIGNRLNPVMRREFTNGGHLEGTPDHPIWTNNRGWVQFGELTPEDVCHTVPECGSTSKSSYLKEIYTTGARSILTIGSVITSVERAPFFTSIFGNRTTRKKFQKDTSSTTKTTSLWTIASTIWNACLEQNTRGTTKSWSGKLNALTQSCASFVKNILSVEAHTPSLDFVGGNALRARGLQPQSVPAAETSTHTEKITHNASVLKPAPTGQQEILKRVYNLEVEDAHTYYANDILVHNCDEELDESLFDELMFRLASTEGYFHMVFTATRGQEMWKDAMEGQGTQEKFPDAFKQQISTYDCLVYDDGTPSHWSEARIERLKNTCKSHQEVLRRVYGRFVLDAGLKYPGFMKSRNFVKPYPIPPDWRIYSAVDSGSGGDSGHPAAILFIAVRPDYQRGAAFKMWRGDGIATTDSDILEQHAHMKADMHTPPVMQVYDWSSKDLAVIANRMGETFVPADKSHDRGESIVNVLLKNGMLEIFDTDDGEGKKLVSELVGLLKSTNKIKAKDDLCDTLRYACTSIPWDWEAITSEKQANKPSQAVKTPLQLEIERRRGDMDEDKDRTHDLEDEIAEWNAAYES